MPQLHQVRSIARRALVAPALTLAMTGCAAPLAGSGVARGVVAGAFDPAGTTIVTRSPQTMGMSGRPSRIFRARIENVTPTTIDITTSFTSGDSIATSPTSFYFHLVDDRGHRSDAPQIVSETPAADAPRAQSYQYQAEVEDGDITNDAGEVVGHTAHAETFTGVAVEHYFTRVAHLRFNRNALIPPDATTLVLEVRDLGASADLTWRLDGSDRRGGEGPPRGYYKPAGHHAVTARGSR